jgi:hypothetical protein
LEFSGIGFVHAGGSKGRGMVDTKIFHGGKASARLEKTNRKGWSAIYIASRTFAPLKNTRFLDLKLFVRAENAKGGQIVITGANKEYHQALWTCITTFTGTFDWKEFSGRVVVPPEIKKVEISVRTSAGKVWCDDIAAKWIDPLRPYLPNAGFQAYKVKATNLPGYWTLRALAGNSAKVTAGVVSPGFKSSRAVSIAWKSGGEAHYALVSHSFDTLGCRQLMLTGQFKAQKCEVCISAEFFKDDKVLSVKSGKRRQAVPEWTAFSHKIKVPESADAVSVMLEMHGKGRAFFDKLQIRTLE